MAQTPEDTKAAPGLLEPAFLRKLEQAAISSRHILRGRSKGERRSSKKGSSVEFADFRSYSPGDDLRYLDWNAYARLQKLFLKLFLEEEDLHVYVLLDASASMGFGTPEKFGWGLRAAGALAYIALSSDDRVQLFCHHADDVTRSRMFRGRGSAPEAFEWLIPLRPEGGTDLVGACDAFLRSIPAPGVTFLISDLLCPDWEATLGRLAAAKGEVCVIQVLAPDEYTPDLQGDLRLVDSETEEAREITIGSSVLRRYERTRDEFIASVRGTCHRYGFSHLLSLSDDPVEDVVLRQLRRLQVIR